VYVPIFLLFRIFCYLYFVCCLCVNVCCTTATGCPPKFSWIYLTLNASRNSQRQTQLHLRQIITCPYLEPFQSSSGPFPILEDPFYYVYLKFSGLVLPSILWRQSGIFWIGLCNIVLPFTPKFPSCSLSHRSPQQNSVLTSPVSHTCHMPRRSQSSWSDHPNIWW
jgi:hypothetical protein